MVRSKSEQSELQEVDPKEPNLNEEIPDHDLADGQQNVRLQILKRVARNAEIVTDPESPSLQKVHAFLTRNFNEGEVEPLEVFKAELASNEVPNSPSRFICVVLRDPIHNAVVSCAYGSVQNGIIAIRFTLTESHLHIDKPVDSAMDRDDDSNFINYRGTGISQEADRLLIQAAQKHTQEQGQDCEAIVAEAVERSEKYWNEVQLEPKNGLRRLYDPKTGKQVYYRLPPLAWNQDGTPENDDIMVENLQVALKNHADQIPTAKLAQILHDWWQVWYIRPESQFEDKAAWEKHKATVESILQNEILAPISRLEHVVPKSRAEREQTQQTPEISAETQPAIPNLAAAFEQLAQTYPAANSNQEKQELRTTATSSEKPAPAKAPSTLDLIKQQAVETLHLYKNIAKEPSLIAKGTVEVFKDLFYNLPRSFFRKENVSTEEQLKRKGSQALVISEGLGMAGAIAGATLATKVLELSPMVSGIIAPILGHYIAASTSYIASFVLLARKCEGYNTKKALIAGLKTVRDCLPIAVVSYAADAPIPAILVAAGVPPQLAAIIYTLVDTAIFTGIAKIAANTETATKEEK